MKLIIFIFIFLLFTPFAYANDINIICQSEGECSSPSNLPLFSQDNIYPGFKVTSHLKIINLQSSQCKLNLEIVKGKRWNDKLSKSIEMKILSTSNILFSGRLSDILTQKNITLNTIKPNESETIDWSASLNSNTGNDFQNLTTNFDLNYKFDCAEVLGTTSSPNLFDRIKHFFSLKIVFGVGAVILIYFILAKVFN
ncbi:MAG: hypothetical protein Q8P53_02190 [Candidatus Shapirobacteria bacterium]|nr:hypothetical protein [Candidatus Shapirobacteria bacterium]